MKKFLKYFAISSFVAILFSILIVFIYKFVPVYYTPLMIIRSIESDYGINHKWVPLENISKSLSKSVIRSEDAKFYTHNGFDFEAIKKAQEYNKKHKKKKGASTITQQTAKNVFLWPTRSYIRKGVEAYFTVLIELIWGKDRIMEVYLNSIEFGPGIYGAEACAKKFFKKSAIKINNSEAALMASVLPNPIKFKIDHPSAYILKRQSRILGRMAAPEKEIEAESMQEFLDIKFDDETQNENSKETSSASSAEPETIAQ